MPALTIPSGSQSGLQPEGAIWTAGCLALLGVLGASIFCEPFLVLSSVLAAALVFLVFSRPIAGLWLLVALTPIEMIGPVTFHATKACKLGLALVAVAAVFMNTSDCRPAGEDPYRWRWLLFAASGFFASLVSQSALVSLVGLASLLIYMLLYQAVRRLKIPLSKAARLLQTICVLGVLFSGLALAQTFNGYGGLLGSREQQAMEAEGLVNTLWPGIDRASALFNLPTAAGAFLALAAVIAAAHAMVTSKRRALYLLALIASFAGVLATFSRGAILGCVSGTAFAWFALGRWRARQLMVFLLASVLVLGALFSDNGVRGYLRIGADLASVSPSRFDAWTAAFAIIPRHPLFGIGFYQFQEMSQGLEGFSDTPVHPHNGFLKALVEQGPVGAIAYLLFAAIFIKSSWRSARCAREPEHCWISAAIGGAGVALFTQELFDAGLVVGGSSIALLFASLLAVQSSLISETLISDTMISEANAPKTAAGTIKALISKA
jgi:O-antigen ligase